MYVVLTQYYSWKHRNWQEANFSNIFYNSRCFYPNDISQRRVITSPSSNELPCHVQIFIPGAGSYFPSLDNQAARPYYRLSGWTLTSSIALFVSVHARVRGSPFIPFRLVFSRARSFFLSCRRCVNLTVPAPRTRE